ELPDGAAAGGARHRAHERGRSAASARARGERLHDEERLRPDPPGSKDSGASVVASKSPGAPVPLRVFIFNDSPTMRVALKAALTQFPDIVVVAEADSAEHASELIERAKPDVVLMDVIMPGKDGYEATREIMDRVPTP